MAYSVGHSTSSITVSHASTGCCVSHRNGGHWEAASKRSDTNIKCYLCFNGMPMNSQRKWQRKRQLSDFSLQAWGTETGAEQ